MRLGIIIFFNILLFNVALAQPIDLLNSDTYQLLLNPASTGNHQYDWNIYNVYNTKQIIANNNFSSLYIMGDYQVYFFPDKLSLGASVQRNSIFNSPIYQNLIFISAAYHKNINLHSFHFGIQPAFVFYELASSKFLFPDQYDRNTGGYNSAIPTNEIIENEKIKYLDVNLGLVYSYSYKKFKPEIGISLFHLNKPSISYISDNEKLALDMSVQLKSSYYYSNEIIILPEITFITKQNLTQIKIGSDAFYGLNRNAVFVRSFMVGAHFVARNNKHPNSLIFNIGIKINHLNIILGYNNSITSKNGLPNNIQTFEIGLIFNGFNSNIDKYSVPCEIF